MAEVIVREKKCRKCGGSYVGQTCKPCKRIYDIEYQRENAEKLNAQSIEWRRKNAQSINANSSVWYFANIERRKKSADAYRRANIERYRVTSRAWRVANRDHVNARQSAAYAKDPEKYRAYVKKWADANLANWQAANRDRIRGYGSNRRARKLNNGGRLSKGLADRLFKLQRGKCPCCGKPLGNDYHMDHKMPLVLGGPNTDENIQLLRKRCNLQKKAKHPVDFMQSRGFLL